MGLQQFFGILTIMDCTEMLIEVGLVMMIVGVIVGAAGYHFLRHWD